MAVVIDWDQSPLINFAAYFIWSCSASPPPRAQCVELCEINSAVWILGRDVKPKLRAFVAAPGKVSGSAVSVPGAKAVIDSRLASKLTLMCDVYSPLPVAAYIRIIWVQSLTTSGPEEQEHSHDGNREPHCCWNRRSVFRFDSSSAILPNNWSSVKKNANFFAAWNWISITVIYISCFKVQLQ